MPHRLSVGRKVTVLRPFIDRDDTVIVKKGLTGRVEAVADRGDILLRLGQDLPELPLGCLLTVEAEDVDALAPDRSSLAQFAANIPGVSLRDASIVVATLLLASAMLLHPFGGEAGATHHGAEAVISAPGPCALQAEDTHLSLLKS